MIACHCASATQKDLDSLIAKVVAAKWNKLSKNGQSKILITPECAAKVHDRMYTGELSTTRCGSCIEHTSKCLILAVVQYQKSQGFVDFEHDQIPKSSLMRAFKELKANKKINFNLAQEVK